MEYNNVDESEYDEFPKVNPATSNSERIGEILTKLTQESQEMGLYEHTEDFQTKPGFVERRMKLGKEQNDRDWDKIYSEYSDEQYPPFGGPFTDALSFIDWLKQNYISPDRI